MTEDQNKANPPAASNPPAEKKAKKAKKKGPIRWEAILPFCVFVAIVWAYFALFFDGHLRRGLEFVGTYANGAEVNIDDIDTSFWKASLVIRNVQVTDVDQPSFNKIQIGSMRWRMLWDALLRGKVAIADASILDIGVGTPRKHPGRVLPKDPPGSESMTDKLREQALNQAQKQFEGNVLGDVASLLDGADPKEQLKNIQTSLASDKRIKELQDELQKKGQEWKNRLAALPQAKELKAYDARLKAIKLDGFKNPAEVQQSVREIDAIIKEVDAKVKDVEATGKAVGGDVNTYTKAIKDLEAMIQKDIKDLESRLKIPKLDVKNIAMSLFGPMFLTKVRQAQFYMSKAREYMPPKKTKEEKAEFQAPKPHERIAGRNYKFGRPNTYPLFWLQNAEISSKAGSFEWSGDLSGKLTNLTDDPPAIGLPTVLTFKGDFPKQQLQDVFGELHIDHTTATPLERVTLRVGAFKVKGQQLVNSPDIQLGFADAVGSSELKVELQQENVSISSNSAFDKISYNVGAKTKIVGEILQNIMNSVPRVTVDANVGGNWSALNFDVRSNLSGELQKGFERELEARIAEAKLKVRQFIDEKIGAEKTKLLAEYKKIEDQIKGEITSKQADIAKYKSQLENTKNKALKEQTNKLESEGKKHLDKLLKGKNLRF